MQFGELHLRVALVGLLLLVLAAGAAYFFLRPAPIQQSNNSNSPAAPRGDESGGLIEAALPISADDAREVRELKQIVNGLREEMNAYLANGNGTLRSYWRRLMARTREEMQIYERTRRELERENDPKVWDAKNEALRNLGIRTIPNPKEAE